MLLGITPQTKKAFKCLECQKQVDFKYNGRARGTNLISRVSWVLCYSFYFVVLLATFFFLPPICSFYLFLSPLSFLSFFFSLLLFFCFLLLFSSLFSHIISYHIISYHIISSLLFCLSASLSFFSFFSLFILSPPLPSPPLSSSLLFFSFWFPL